MAETRMQHNSTTNKRIGPTRARNTTGLVLVWLLSAGTTSLISQEASAHETAAKFTYSNRSTHSLRTGETYTIEVRNLRGAGAKTRLWVFDTTSSPATLVASHGFWSLGGSSSGSSVTLSVPGSAGSTKSYRVLVTAGASYSCGIGDLKITDGYGYTSTTANIQFCGDNDFVAFHKGECFETERNGSPTDPYVYLIELSKVYWDDDSGTASSLDSRLCMNHDGYGHLIKGSYSISSEGNGSIDLVEHTSLTHNGSVISMLGASRSFDRVYRRTISTVPGQTYIVGTSDLRTNNAWRDMYGPAADTYMYVVNNSTKRIVAYNDDYYGLSSQVSFVAASGSHTVIVRSYSEATKGSLDLYVNGYRYANDALFGGLHMRTFMKKTQAGSDVVDCVETSNNAGDPYFYWLPIGVGVGAPFIMNDDGGSGVNSKVCFSDYQAHPAYTGYTWVRGRLYVGSFSESSTGIATIKSFGSGHR